MKLTNLHTQLIPVLTEAQKLLVAGFKKKVNHKQKSVGQDTMSIVTETDTKIDNFFRKELFKLFPQIGFISEELEDTKLREYNWIIDPIDGTLNFTRKIPIFGISIGLWHRNEPVYGLLSMPLIGQRLDATRGNGLFLNGQRPHKFIHNLDQPYIYYAQMGSTVDRLEVINMIATKYNVPRMVSCAIFAGMMTTLGNADATVYLNQGLWDIAAVWAIAKEAGLACEFLSPPPNIFKNNYGGYQHSIIIGQPKLVKSLAKDVKSVLNL